MPRVSIGVPVFNGEEFIEAAVQSLLDQTYNDIELNILDNCSSDRTPSICRRLLSQNRHIRYYRNEKNIGAAANFNRTFAIAKGEYFKWAAHDDICDPKFIERCVEVLDSDNTVVLAYPRAVPIDTHGQKGVPYEINLPTDSTNSFERFRGLLKGHKCYEIFGLIRRDALEKTNLIGAYAHGDGVLLAHLALIGRFVEIPEHLFYPRSHPAQSMTIMKKKKGRGYTSEEYVNYATWFDPMLKGKMLFPYWKILFEYCRIINASSISYYEKILCYRHLSKWAYTRRRRLKSDLFFNVKKIRTNRFHKRNYHKGY
jgi:glycosyltransferase involved in cell wall biosynthesis